MRKHGFLTGLCLLACCAGMEMETAARPAVPFTVRGGLPNFYRKAEAGSGTVKVGYFGGSITAAAGWRVQTLAWMNDTFKGVKFVEINGAISGTNSSLGAYRLQQDVLQHKPDLVFVEFAVNDGGPEEVEIRSMEGIVRQIWRRNPETDVCFVYTMTGNMLKEFEAGNLPRVSGMMEIVADYYKIPSIHMGYHVAELHRGGKLVFQSKENEETRRKILADQGIWHFTGDNVHPFGDTGHPLYTDAVKEGFKAIRENVQPAVLKHELIAPLRADNLENAKMVQIEPWMLKGTWRKMDPKTEQPAKQMVWRMPNLWVAESVGSSIEFKFKGTEARIYDLSGPDCGIVTYTVDGRNLGRSVRMTGGYWSDCYILGTVDAGRNLEDGIHTVKVEIAPEPIPDKLKFLNNSPKYKNMTAEELAASPFNKQNWYVSNVLIVGDIVK